MNDSYQLIIIGGGPAGLTAGLYAARARLQTLLLDRIMPGGQIVNAELIENYPGFPDGISGPELASLMEQQAKKYGLEIAMAEAEKVDPGGEQKIIHTGEGQYKAKALIIAGGSEHGKLGVPGEEALRGKGVSYCATCDGAFFRDQIVAVIGGGNVALNDALFLTRFATKVIVIHRRDELRATKILQERAFAQPKVEFLWDTVVKSIEGDARVRTLKLHNVKTEAASSLEVDGVFVAVGYKPNTGYLEGLLTLSPEKTIVVDDSMATSVPGVFAAGDIRAGSPRQVSCAVGDGAVAAISAEKYLSSI